MLLGHRVLGGSCEAGFGGTMRLPPAREDSDLVFNTLIFCLSWGLLLILIF